MQRRHHCDTTRPGRQVSACFPCRQIERAFDEVHVRLHRALECLRVSQTPARHGDLAIIAPAVVFVNRFDAIEVFTGLKVETLRPNLIVERRDQDEVVGRGLHNRQWRAHAVGRTRPVQVAAAERVSAEEFVVLLIR